MTINEVYAYYGSGFNASKAIGLKPQAFAIWKRRGYIPINAQFKYEEQTNGYLVADMNEQMLICRLNKLK